MQRQAKVNPTDEKQIHKTDRISLFRVIEISHICMYTNKAISPVTKKHRITFRVIEC